MKKIFLIFLTGLFVLPTLGAAMQKELYINEIAWMGSENSANDEWIELYNPGPQNYDLSGCSLESADGQPEIELSGLIAPGSYFLLERTDDTSVPEQSADLIYTGSLSNDGEHLELSCLDKGLIDFVDASDSWSAGDNDTKKTMQLIAGNWLTSDESGGSPGAKNVFISDSGQDSSESFAVDNTPERTKNKESFSGDIVINELVSDPSDGGVEWVELYNKSSDGFSLDGFYLLEGSGSKTILAGYINPDDYFVVESPKGNLNNSGDSLELYSVEDEILDSLSYGDWDGASFQAAKDPFSLARLKDSNDFVIAENPSKGSANYAFGPKGNNAALSSGPLEVLISEILPNPQGNERDEEYIELYNYSEQEISLFGWSLVDSSERKYFFGKEDSILPEKYFLLHRSSSGVVLNNSGDSLGLFSPEGRLIYSLSYNKAEEGFSYNNTELKEVNNIYDKGFKPEAWLWSNDLSPGEKNIFQWPNLAPEVDFSFSDELFSGTEIFFDSGDSYDPEGEPLSYHWNFGDGFENRLQNPGHTYMQPGSYKVELSVSDGQSTSSLSRILEIKQNTSISAPEQNNLGQRDFSDAKIIISEVLPDPDGDDREGEYIEIYNAGTQKLNLADWVLDDMEGGSKPYVFSSESEIDSGEYFVLNRTDSDIVLNNSYDRVRIFSPDQKLVDEIEYNKTSGGRAYFRSESGDWVWAESISPGLENKYLVESNNNIYSPQPREGGADVYFSPKTPREIQNHAAGQKALAEGVVNSLPGTFSSQYFYIEGDGGLQIYSYYKDFPDLEVGDFVQVSGEISKINGEARLKTDSSDDIEILDRNYIINPIELETELDDSHIGRLISLRGKVLQKEQSSLVLASAIGYVDIAFKEGSGLAAGDFSVDDYLDVGCVVSTDRDGFVCLPRDEGDIEFIESEKSVKNNSGEVLGRFSGEKEWSIDPKESKQSYYLWSFIILGSGVLLFFLYKKGHF